MVKQRYYPDGTGKNIFTVLRAKNNGTIVLSCKKCPTGVSPKWKYYSFALLLLSNFLGFLFCTLFYDQVFSFVDIATPAEWSNKTNMVITIILLILCWLLIGPIIVLLSFHFSKWIPAESKRCQSENTEIESTGDGSL